MGHDPGLPSVPLLKLSQLWLCGAFPVGFHAVHPWNACVSVCWSTSLLPAASRCPRPVTSWTCLTPACESLFSPRHPGLRNPDHRATCSLLLGHHSSRAPSAVRAKDRGLPTNRCACRRLQIFLCGPSYLQQVRHKFTLMAPARIHDHADP